MAEKHAYTQAASTGQYERVSGLNGKYDNVRRFWEDQVTGIFLRPALNDVVEKRGSGCSGCGCWIWAAAAATAMI
jgi:hypothetical protein